MAPVTGLWVNVGIAPGPSLRPGKNAIGVNKVALQVAAPSYVNTVSSSLTVPCSTFAFTGVDS